MCTRSCPGARSVKLPASSLPAPKLQQKTPVFILVLEELSFSRGSTFPGGGSTAQVQIQARGPGWLEIPGLPLTDLHFVQVGCRFCFFVSLLNVSVPIFKSMIKVPASWEDYEFAVS